MRRRRHEQHRHRRRHHTERPGYDIVNTPFGQRAVRLGHGWREATKWMLWRAAAWLIGIAVAIVLGLLILRTVTHELISHFIP